MTSIIAESAAGRRQEEQRWPPELFAHKFSNELLLAKITAEAEIG